MNKGKICVSVCAGSATETLLKTRRAEDQADVIEVRFDCLSPAELESAIQQVSSTVPIIATYRSPGQGGNTNASIDERRAFWSAAPGGVWCVDLEEDIFDTVTTDAKRILSFHDHLGVPTDLGNIAARMSASNADFIKVAVRANDIVDCIPVWKLLEKDARVIPIAMGEAGKWTRILGLAHGAALTYASLDTGSETAHGQITARDLIDVYRATDLNRETHLYGVIGDPVSASMSPYLHNPAFHSAGLNSVFLPLEVRDLDGFIRRMVRAETREIELNFAGFAVTMPHKQAIMRHLDEIDPVAQAIGAVNTVKVNGSKLTGYNTDAAGFIVPLRRSFGELEGANVAVAGTGGAARACVYGLKNEGAVVTILGRNRESTASVASKLDVAHGEIQTAPLSAFEVVVNATPVGMKGVDEDNSLFTVDQMENVRLVYDLVTSMTDTPLITAAKKAGIRTIGGLEMLVAQAELQFTIWTGETAPEGIMERSLITLSKT